jgi:uncharacterized membrane protein HdeD (DUF308 family)
MTDTMTAPAAPQPAAAEAVYPWWLVLIQGIAALVIGVLLLAYPVKTTVALIYVIGWWWLITGIFDLISLIWSREMWGWKVFTGLLGIIAGAYIIEHVLVGTAIVLGTVTLLLGINGMIIGVIDIVKAFQGAGWGKGILGVLSLILGAVIAFRFAEFAKVLPWVWGILGIVFGIAAIVMSFQVRKIQET